MSEDKIPGLKNELDPNNPTDLLAAKIVLMELPGADQIPDES